MFKKFRTWWKRIRLAWRLAYLFATLAIIYLVAGFLILPWGARHLAQSQLTQTLGRTVTIDRVRFNPLTLEVDVEGLRVNERDSGDAFVSLGRLYTDLSAASLFSLAAVADTVRLEHPYVHVVRSQPNVYNFTDILETLASGANAQGDAAADGADDADEDAEGDVMPVVVRNFAVVNGTARFDDLPLSGVHTVERLNLSVPFTSGLEEDMTTFVEPRLQLVLDGREVDMSGRTLPFHDSMRTEFRLDVDKLDLSTYWDYVPVHSQSRLVSGLFSCGLNLSLERGDDILPRVSVSGVTQLDDVALEGPGGERFAGFESLRVPLERFDLLDRLVALGDVTLSAPFARLRRGADGTLDVMAWLPGVGGGESESVVAAAADDTRGITVDDNSTRRAAVGENATEAEEADLEADPEAEKTFLITATSVGVDKLAVDFADASVAAENGTASDSVKPFAASYVADVHLGGVRSDLSAPIPFSVSVSGTGPVAAAGADEERVLVDGSFDVAAMSGAGNCTVSGVNVARYSPYYRDAVPYAVRSGVLNVSGAWAFGGGNATRVRFNGGVGLGGALLADKETGRDSLGLETLTLQGVDVDTAPLQARVNELKLGAFAFHDPATGRTLARVRSGVVRGVAYAGAQNRVGVESLALSGLGLLDPEKFRNFASVDGVSLRSVDVALDPLAAKLGSFSLRGAALEDAAAQSRLASLAELLVRNAAMAANGDVHADLVRVQQPEADFVVDADGVMNLTRVLAPFTGVDPAANATAEAAPAEIRKNGAQEPDATGADTTADTAGDATGQAGTAGPVVSVDRVEVAEGRTVYRDESLTPAYFTQVADMQARLIGFSTKPGSSAGFGLNATIDGHAPLRASGTVAALDTVLRTDMKLSVRNLAMPPMSPYTRKYIAYPLATGKFNTTVALRIEGPQLDMDNMFLIQNLTLGEKVDSPDAPSLPIQLGLALLTDSDGNMEMDVPVQGRLDDPQFRLGKVIFGAIINLFGKIVTAPFALLGSLFEGGEETGFLAFAPGSAALSPDAVAKLDSVAEALAKRPRLRVELAGFVDADRDRPALADRTFADMLRHRKLLRLQDSGEAGPDADLTVSAQEYPELLAEVYESAEFERPENAFGILKDQPVEVMEAMIREHIVITDAQLLELARQRAAVARDHLVAQGMVEPERVFLKDVTLDAPTEQPELPTSRVEILLR